MNMKQILAKITADKKGLQKRTVRLKRSLDEVNQLLDSIGKRKKKP